MGYDGTNKLYEITYLDGTFDQYDHDEMKRYYKELQKYSHEDYDALRSVPNQRSRIGSSSTNNITSSGIRLRPVDADDNPVKGRWRRTPESDPHPAIVNKTTTPAVATETRNSFSDVEEAKTTKREEKLKRSQNSETNADPPTTTAPVLRSRRQLSSNQENTNSNADNNCLTLRSSNRSSRALNRHELPERNAAASIPEVTTRALARNPKRKRTLDPPNETSVGTKRNLRELPPRYAKRRNMNNNNKYPTRSTRAATRTQQSRAAVQTFATTASKKENDSVTFGRSTRSSRAATRLEERKAVAQSSVSRNENDRAALMLSTRSSRAAKRSEKDRAAAQSSDATEEDQHTSLTLSTRSSRAVASLGKSRATRPSLSSTISADNKNSHQLSRASKSNKKEDISKVRSTTKGFKIKTKNQNSKLTDFPNNEVESSRRSIRERLRKSIRMKNIDHVLLLSNWSPSRPSLSKQKYERKRHKKIMPTDASMVQSKNSIPLWSTAIALGHESQQETGTMSSDGSSATIDTTGATVVTRTPAPGNKQQSSQSKLVDKDHGASESTLITNETCLKTEEQKEPEKSIDFLSLNVLMKPTAPSQEDVYAMCRNNSWHSMLGSIQSYPEISTMILMQRSLSFSTTTILHQAIISKGDIKIRDPVIRKILYIAPHAAAIKDSSGSLPLHHICQCNLTMNYAIKEMLICILIDAYPDALTQEAGKTMSTPLHLACKDDISTDLLEIMVQAGTQACFMFDKDGFLPVHIACSHAKSPKYLEILLAANPGALFAETGDGRTLLTLTQGMGNYELLSFIETKMMAAGVVVSPLSQTIGIDIPSSENFTEDLAKNRSGGNHESEGENVETANLLLHFAGRFQNDTSRRLVW